MLKNMFREKGTLAIPYLWKYKWYRTWYFTRHDVFPKPAKNYPHALWKEARRWEAVQYVVKYAWHTWVKRDW
jgi:hypothetical protein